MSCKYYKYNLFKLKIHNKKKTKQHIPNYIKSNIFQTILKVKDDIEKGITF